MIIFLAILKLIFTVLLTLTMIGKINFKKYAFCITPFRIMKQNEDDR